MKLLVEDPKWSRRGAQVIQDMPSEIRDRFVDAMRKAKRVEDLPAEFANYLRYGYPKESNKATEPDNITDLSKTERTPYSKTKTASIDEILDNIQFEWIEE